MATEPWIKVRESIFSDPKILSMAKALASNPKVAGYVFRDGARDMLGVTPTVTRDVMRDVTVTGLIRVWVAANRHTVDGTFHHADTTHIDDIAGIPGFGDAMIKVGYAMHDQDADSITLPNFHEHNAPARKTASATERQRRWRERQKQRLRDVTETRDITRDETPTNSADKTRLESTTTTTTTPPRDRGCSIEEALTFATTHNVLPADGLTITPEIVRAWHDARTAQGWCTIRENGAEVPIRDWQADLRSYTRKWVNRERATGIAPAPGSRRPAPTQPVKTTTDPKNGF